MRRLVCAGVIRKPPKIGFYCEYLKAIEYGSGDEILIKAAISVSYCMVCASVCVSVWDHTQTGH